MNNELVCTAVKTLAWRHGDPAPLKPDQVCVQAEFGAAKHGTEMAIYKGAIADRGAFDYEWRLHERSRKDAGSSEFPVPLGNMVVGKVSEKGKDVTSLAIGDTVLAYGGFKRTHVVSACSCWKLPAGLSWKSAVCLDPADFAVGALRDGNVRVGDALVIFGVGAIGLVAIHLAGRLGAYPIIAIDPLPNRRAAAGVCGAHYTLDPKACDAGHEIKSLTSKRGADVCIEYSGTAAALQAALRGIALGGTIVMGAFPPPYAAGLDFGAEAHMNIPQIVFSRACSEPNRDHPRWNNQRIYETCWRLICEGVIDGEPIVQPVVPFDNLIEEYPRIESHPHTNIKLGVQF